MSVVRLRRNGPRLRPSELDLPMEGDLRIQDDGPGSFKRPLLSAQLWASTFSVVDRPVGLPLFDPQIVHMEGPTFSLLGIELAAGEGRVAEHIQVWRCTVVSKA